jgi:hypothetical protein
MSEPAAVKVKLRIPGQWAGPKELIDRLPAEFHFTPEALVLPDGTEIEFGAVPADDEFAKVFRSACRQPAKAEELATINSYTVNVILIGRGGSLDAARAMMQAGAAIVQAGGAGVFIDNSALAHGGQNWAEMADDGGPDAISFAFVSIIRGRTEAYTMGMHVLGLRDIVMKSTDAANDEFGIIDVIRYMAASEKPVDDGHLLADLSGTRFRANVVPSASERTGSPMHNPYGRLKLVSMRDIAETN